MLQQAWKNKLSTQYDPKAYTVVDHKDPSLILQRVSGCVFMCNVSHVHKLHQNTIAQEEDGYDMDVSVPQIANQDFDPLQAVDQDVWRPVRVRRAPAHLSDYQL